jgi:hypothetical protein
MKIYLITYLLLVTNQLLEAQTSFFRIYRRPSHERAVSAEQMGD